MDKLEEIKIDKLEELKIKHEETANQPRELFIKQLHHFRKRMCYTKYTKEEKVNEFGFLLETYVRCKLEKGDIDLMVATKNEFDMRLEYE